MSDALPPRPLTRAEVREVDRRAIEDYGVPGAVLMENAGVGLTRIVEEELRARGGSVVGIVCGRGNNGGDGFVLARHLALRGYSPRVVYCGLLAEANRETDAGVNLTIVERAGQPLEEAQDAAKLVEVLQAWNADLLVDALFGTGLSSDLRPDALALVEALDAAEPPIVAVDIPSGLDCDRGAPLGGAVHAVRTVTFVAEKAGFSVDGARAFTGEVDVVPIGCPAVCWDHAT